MNRARLVRLMLIFVFSLALLPVAPAAAYGPVLFSGSVLDAGSGDPLPYATVRLFTGANLIAETTTDQWGRFSFDYDSISRVPWERFWQMECFARISRTGWTSATTKTKSMKDWDWDWDSEGLVFGTYELTRQPGVTPLSPIYGENRFETAKRISQAAYPDGLDHSPAHTTVGTVVIASGTSWADALLAASVAGVEDAPIILAGGGYEPWGYPYYGPYPWAYDPMKEIRRLSPDRAIIVGGERAVPLDAEVNLRIWLGGDDVVRLWGDDRYGTARAASTYVMENLSVPTTTAVVATGLNYADVLAASAIIWHEKLPLYLTSASGIDSQAVDEMVGGGITDVVIVGGEAAVPASVEASLAATFGGAHVSRIGGRDRYATSALLAQWAIDEFGMDFEHVALASGQKATDALAGGPLQGGSGSLLLLTRRDGVPPVIAELLADNAAEIEEVRFLGGPRAVYKSVWTQVRELMGD